MQTPLFNYRNKEISLSIKSYENGLEAMFFQDSRESATQFKDTPVFRKVSKLLDTYDFKECGIIFFHGAPPHAYGFHRHDKLEYTKLSKKEFILEDFKKDFAAILAED